MSVFSVASYLRNSLRIAEAIGAPSIWTSFFEVFGINALILYVSSEFIAIFFGKFGVTDAVFGLLSAWIPCGPVASLIYATLFMLLNWMVGYELWRRRIIIKL